MVEDGEEALAYLFRPGKYKDPATSQRPDLILPTRTCPRVNGRGVLEQTWVDSKLRRMAVVMLTADRFEMRYGTDVRGQR
jgi:hypothetical protein